VSVPSSELAPAAPSPVSECVPPPEPKRGGQHSLAGEGAGGGSQFGLQERKPGTQVYSVVVSFGRLSLKGGGQRFFSKFYLLLIVVP
jgi:hypothetical protein